MSEIKYFYLLQIFHIVCSYFIFHLLILSGLFNNSSVKSPKILSVTAVQLLLASLQEWTSLVVQMVTKYWSFSFNISPSNEHPILGLNEAACISSTKGTVSGCVQR